jgi:TatD DNase family protein
MTGYRDIHCHLDDARFDDDREQVISACKDAGIAAMTVGTDVASCRAASALASTHEHIYACLGIHPRHDDDSGREEIEKLAMDEKVRAIGECGLDFFRFEGDVLAERARQTDLFLWHIDLARRLKKPLMIHARGTYRELLDILEAHPDVTGNAHFFAGSVEEARRFLNLGYTLSFTGVITFAHDYDEVVRFVPDDRIHAETDTPYVAPVPFRGTRNEPTRVPHVAKALAGIKGRDEADFAAVLRENAFRSFGIPA